MDSPSFQDVADTISTIIDGVGVFFIVAGLVWACGDFAIRNARSTQDLDGSYRRLRQHVGKAILLGLEFLVAADIIRTVAVDPSFESVGVLGIIVVVRTFLSFTLDVELEGRWPWQQAASPPKT